MGNKLQLQEFGPIGAGFTDGDGFLTFPRVTLFCGPQGSGKSTIAKTYAFFRWLEKSLVRGDSKPQYWETYHHFPKKFYEYFNLKDYFRPATCLRYRGSAYDFDYEQGQFSVSKKEDSGEYGLPKIMYVPSERNFMAIAEQVEKLKRVPPPLDDFKEEFKDAMTHFASGVDFPLPGFSFEYDRQNHLPKIVIGKSKKIRLSAASSGLQSVAPLFLVSEYLFRMLVDRKSDVQQSMSREERERILAAARSHSPDADLSQLVKTVFKEYDAAKIRSFVNIVEEPEQNLYPHSQDLMIAQLLKYARGSEEFPNNELVMTTHSPFVVDYLILIAQAHETVRTFGKNGAPTAVNLPERMSEESLMSAMDMVLYETMQDGRICMKRSSDGFFSDDNSLNRALGAYDEALSDLLVQNSEFANG